MSDDKKKFILRAVQAQSDEHRKTMFKALGEGLSIHMLDDWRLGKRALPEGMEGKLLDWLQGYYSQDSESAWQRHPRRTAAIGASMVRPARWEPPAIPYDNHSGNPRAGLRPVDGKAAPAKGKKLGLFKNPEVQPLYPVGR